jgi:hypothetical protein
MPSIDQDSSRHFMVDDRPGHYLCFPDLVRAREDRLVCVYREADRHVATRHKLLFRTSSDQGRTWSQAGVCHPDGGHCPRASRLDDGSLLVVDDVKPALYWSLDQGRTFASHPASGLSHGIFDRILQLGPETLLTTGHAPRGRAQVPAIGQPPVEQMVYVSSNRGRSWTPLSVLYWGDRLVLCEASMVHMGQGRILALMRENSQVHEPMYLAESTDAGRTWSRPRPTGLIGHRPCMDLTSSGKLLVTFRNVALAKGTCAWMGTEEELEDFMVHGLATGSARPVIENDSLVLPAHGENDQARWVLRPLSDPARAYAELHLQLAVEPGEDKGFGVYFGTRWSLRADRVEVGEGAERVEADLSGPDLHAVRLVYDSGEVFLEVDGRLVVRLGLEPGVVERRPVVLGGHQTPGVVTGGWRLGQVLHQTREPAFDRDFLWSWSPAMGLPDSRAAVSLLELAESRDAWGPDFGYSGWRELAQGEYLCVYHHATGREEGYAPGTVSRVRATRFTDADFA